MDHDQTFRIVLIIGFAVLVPIGAYHRLRSQEARESLDRRHALLIAWTFRSLGKNLTDTVVTRREATLVTTGPYRWVRHPFYLAFALVATADALVTANWLQASVREHYQTMPLAETQGSAMTRDEFWQVIEQSGPQAGNTNEQVKRLDEILRSYDHSEISAFQDHYRDVMNDAYRADLVNVMTIIEGGGH